MGTLDELQPNIARVNPQTGDNGQRTIFILLLIASVIFVGTVVIYEVKEKTRNKRR